MKLRKVTLSPLGSKQRGSLLQIIQNEQPSADKATLPIGQISLHLLHLLHFSSSILKGGFLSSLGHDTLLSSIKASFGHALMHAKHFMMSI